MVQVVRCTQCVLPESFPDISFDENGVCSYCKDHHGKQKQVLSIEELKKRLNHLIKESKLHHKQYHAVVAFSGGKDSTYLIHTLKYDYNLHVLAVTFDNGFMSEKSFDNMRIVLDNIGVDHIICRPNQKLLNDIFNQSSSPDIYPEYLTKSGSGICISCIRMVSNMVLRLAIEKNIHLVFLGNSPGQLIQSESEIIYQDNKIPYALKRNLFKPLADKVGEEVYYHLMLDKEHYRIKDFPYIINPFPIIGYDEKLIYKTIEKYGWRRPEDVDPNSSNCRLNSLGIIKHKEVYNFHPYDYEMSMLVRLGIIDRDTALKRVEDPEGSAVKLAKEVEQCLKKSNK